MRFWDRFRAALRPAPYRRLREPAIREALRQFGNTRTLKQMHRVLMEWENALLTEQASIEITYGLARFESEGDLFSFTDWRQLLTMLEDARKNGVNEAWVRFMRQQHLATLALNALMNATTLEKRYVVLKVWREELVSDAAIVQLLELIFQAIEEHDPGHASDLRHLLQLVLECRDYDLTFAWENYVQSECIIACII